jgi:CPA1 family monovalent cation:H+ antiporter
MEPWTIVLAALAMLLIALAVEPLADRLHLPFASLLVLIGFAVSETIVRLGGDTGLRWHHFRDLILHVFLPILVFQSAFHMDLRGLRRRLLPILWLAIPLMLLATAVTGLLLYLGIGHPQAFPLTSALLAGAMLSATDPVAVMALFQRLGAPAELSALMEGESLFNDASAIVLFGLLIGLALEPSPQPDWLAVAGEFALTFLGGLLVGALIGAPAWFLMRVIRRGIPRVIITLAAALGAFYLAEEQLAVSGVVAVLAAGLITGAAHRRFAGEAFVQQLWAFNAYVANALIFLLVGATITVAMFTDRYLAMLLGIGAVLVTRALIVYLLMPPLEWLPRVPRTGWLARNVVFWGGIRGAVTLALVLSLPTELDSWWTIQSIVYGVVLFGLLVQAPTMPWVTRRLVSTDR